MDDLTTSLDSAWDLVPLMGERVTVIHMPATSDAQLGLGGEDVDCAVQGLDRLWPLRLPDGWRLCNWIHYDFKGWYWVIEKEGFIIALDSIDDPLGLGRDSIRRAALIGEGGAHASESLRAAYLAAKRLRKGIRTESEWSRIGQLAGEDPDAFRRTLEITLGERLARRVAGPALESRPPDPTVFGIASVLLRVRRFGSPARLARAGVLGARRYIERTMRPTGLSVFIAGPDGTGKSTLTERLPQACGRIFKRHAVFHWRPGLLPRVGAFFGREQGDAATPHAAPPHARGVSLAVLGYYWLDFCLGALVRILPVRLRAGIVITERGWWDMAIDPKRYRLDVPAPVVRAIGALIPRYDLALILEASPEILLARKAEITSDELRRQITAWRRVLPRGIPREYLDASQAPDGVLRVAREMIVDAMENRAIARLGAGWVTLPNSSAPRWWVPRGPAATARSALAIHQPMTRWARLAWEAAGLLAASGGFRLFPRGVAPPREVRRKLAAQLPVGSTFAVARANHPGRYTALVVDDRGERWGLAKVATDSAGADALEREAAAIRTLGARVPAPLSSPRIRAEEHGLLLLDAVPWRPRSHPWILEADIARALGAFFRSGVIDGPTGPQGPAHGDCAPWNLLRTPADCVLIDWESAALDRPAFHDICHWLVQAYTLLGHPSRHELLRGLQLGEGWVGAAIRSYAEGAELDPSDVAMGMISYLRMKPAEPRTSHERVALSARASLLAELGG